MEIEDPRVYLTSHSSLDVLQHRWREYLALGLAASQSGGTKFSASLAQRYAAGVCGRVTEIDNGLAGLRLARGFAHDISQSDDPDAEAFRYHSESFILRVLGIVDRAHLLVGASLVLPAKKYEGMGGNMYVRKQTAPGTDGIHSALMAVVAAAEKYRPSRNEIVHSSSFSSRELGLIEAVNRLGIDTGTIDVRELAREYFSAQTFEMASSIADLVGTLNALLEALAPVIVVAAEHSELHTASITLPHTVAPPTDG